MSLHLKNYIIQHILILERKYIRYCFRCKIKLSLKDYLITNLNLTERYSMYMNKNNNKEILNKINYLIKIWLSKIIQLYCCNCYVNIKRKEIEKAIKESHKKYFEYRDD